MTTATRTDRRWALVATALGFGVVQLDVTVVNVAIQPIGTALGGGTTGLQWIVNAYTLGLASLILSAGALGDRIGARRVFVGGFAVFTVASGLCGLAPTLGALVAAPAVQGIGAAVLIPGSLTLLTHCLPGRDGARPRRRDLGGVRERRAVGGSAGRRPADRCARLAVDLLHQRSARRPRYRADAPVRGGDAPDAPRDRPARPGPGGRRTRRRRRGHHRRRPVRARPARPPRLRGGRRGAGRVPAGREPPPGADAAADAVPVPHLRGVVGDRLADQHRLLRPDLRLEPVLPDGPRLVRARHRSRVPPGDRGSARRQPARRPAGRRPRPAPGGGGLRTARRRRARRPARRRPVVGLRDARRPAGRARVRAGGAGTGSVIGVALFGALANGRVLPGLRISLVVSIVLALGTVALAMALPRENA